MREPCDIDLDNIETSDLSPREMAILKHYSRKADRLTMLINVALKFNSTLDLLEVLDYAMQAAEQTLQAEASSIFELDDAQQELFIRLARGTKKDGVQKFARLKVGEGVAGWIYANDQAVIIDDVLKDPRFSAKTDQKVHFKTRSIIGAPLHVKGRTIGVIEVINKRNNRRFDHHDLELLTALSSQVATAIENAKLYQKLEDSFWVTVQTMAQTIEQRDPYTGGHVRRVRDLSMAIARHFKQIEGKEVQDLKLAAVLHDIGKIGVEDGILRKTGTLTDTEYEAMKKHPLIGATILQHIRRFREVVLGMKYHHERYDGSGYPEGLSGRAIPKLARIIAMADCFDAMTTNRPYREGLEPDVAFKEIEKAQGQQFDPEVFKAFKNAYEAGEITRAMERRPE